MTLDEHLAAIRDFTQRSDQEFDEEGGNLMIAAELLWGALAHGIIALAELNGWRCEGHQGFQFVAGKLAEGDSLPRWQSDTAAGEQLHTYFYQRNMVEGELQSRRAAATSAKDRLVHILENQQN